MDTSKLSIQFRESHPCPHPDFAMGAGMVWSIQHADDPEFEGTIYTWIDSKTLKAWQYNPPSPDFDKKGTALILARAAWLANHFTPELFAWLYDPVRNDPHFVHPLSSFQQVVSEHLRIRIHKADATDDFFILFCESPRVRR